MEGKWGQFLEAVEKVTKLTIPLQKVIENVEAICEKYRGLLREEGATPEECDELRQLSERLTKIKDDLQNVREKEASKEIIIEFVGATSSGKVIPYKRHTPRTSPSCWVHANDHVHN